MNTSRVPVEGEITNKAAQSLPHECRLSNYRRAIGRRVQSGDQLNIPFLR